MIATQQQAAAPAKNSNNTVANEASRLYLENQVRAAQARSGENRK
jgi:hypothetical protein